MLHSLLPCGWLHWTARMPNTAGWFAYCQVALKSPKMQMLGSATVSPFECAKKTWQRAFSERQQREVYDWRGSPPTACSVNRRCRSLRSVKIKESAWRRSFGSCKNQKTRPVSSRVSRYLLQTLQLNLLSDTEKLKKIRRFPNNVQHRPKFLPFTHCDDKWRAVEIC